MHTLLLSRLLQAVHARYVTEVNLPWRPGRKPYRNYATQTLQCAISGFFTLQSLVKWNYLWCWSFLFNLFTLFYAQYSQYSQITLHEGAFWLINQSINQLLLFKSQWYLTKDKTLSYLGTLKVHKITEDTTGQFGHLQSQQDLMTSWKFVTTAESRLSALDYLYFSIIWTSFSGPIFFMNIN